MKLLVIVVLVTAMTVFLGIQNVGPLKWLSTRCPDAYVKVSDGDGAWDYFCKRK